MSIKADCHLHSSFSGDSQAPMPEMIDKGLALGLETMCFTEHNDFDYPRTEEGPGTIFLLNTDSYLYDVLRCRAKYEGKMRILFGVELGLQPHLADRNEDFISAYDFDFVIGSTHLCKGMDPYYPEYFEKFSSEEEAIRAYFAETLENLKCHDDYDVLGHLDYIVRVAPTKDKNYSYDKYKDAIDPILELLVQQGIGALLSGRTSFVIAHRLSTIQNADRIFVIDQGGILEQGSPAELMEKKGAYYKLYMAQFAGLQE